MSIPNHSQDVDPTLKEIVIRFNRPVRSVRDQLNVRDPRFNEIHFDSTETILTIAVVLEPAHEYQFVLTWPGGEPFVSTEGVPLNDYTVDFRTKAAADVSTHQ